jgi:hypothetical protein
MSYARDREDFIVNATRYGITPDDARLLMRHASTLGRWAVEECNGTLERRDDGSTVRKWNIDGPGPIRSVAVRDTATPAERAVERIAARYGLRAVIQGDPRGAIVTICRPEDVRDEHNYRGLPVPERNV